jgi:hypothetical protein
MLGLRLVLLFGLTRYSTHAPTSGTNGPSAAMTSADANGESAASPADLSSRFSRPGFAGRGLFELAPEGLAEGTLEGGAAGPDSGARAASSRTRRSGMQDATPPARALRQNATLGSASPSTATAGLRIAYGLCYAGAAAFSMALLARPALLWLYGLGVRGPVLAARVPLGAAFFAVAVLLCGATLRLALALAGRVRPRIPEHAAFLMLLGCALGLRGAAEDVQPAEDPAPALRAGLRAVAAALERSYSPGQGYSAEPMPLEAAIAELARPGFALRGRLLPLRVRVIGPSSRPQTDALPGDPPGTLYVALSPDGNRAYLTALTLREGRPEALRAGDGRALILKTRGGTHGELGQDPLLPSYPSQLR